MIYLNPIPAPTKLLKQYHSYFDDYLHFSNEYEKAVECRRFYLAAEIGSYIHHLQVVMLEIDRVLMDYINQNIKSNG